MRVCSVSVQTLIEITEGDTFLVLHTEKQWYTTCNEEWQEGN